MLCPHDTQGTPTMWLFLYFLMRIVLLAVLSVLRTVQRAVLQSIPQTVFPDSQENVSEMPVECHVEVCGSSTASK